MTRKRAKGKGNRGGKRKKSSGNNENIDRSIEENFIMVDISLKSSKDGQDNTFNDSIQNTEDVITPTLDQRKEPLSNITAAPSAPNTTPEIIEDTPPTKNKKYNILESRRKPLESRPEAPPFVLVNNQDRQSKNTANIFHSVDEDKRPPLVSHIRNVYDVATLESCDKPNVQERQISVVTVLRDNSQGVMVSSLDKDKNQQQSNALYSVTSPNTSFDLVEGTPPARHQCNESAAVTSDNNKELQSEDAANVSRSVDQSKQTTPQASCLLSDHDDATSNSCNKPLQEQQVSVISESRDSSEDVLILSLDKNKNQQQSNAPNSVTSPNTSFDLIEGTPPAMHQRNQTAAVVSDNNNDLQSEYAANLSGSVDQSKQTTPQTSCLLNDHNDATSNSCNKPLQEVQVSVISDLRNSNEDVLISSLDKNKNQQQSNASNSVTSPNTSFDLIEGTPPAMHQRNQTAAVVSDNNNDLQSEYAANLSGSVDQSKQTTPQTSCLLNDHNDATSDSCNKPLQEVQVSVISDLRNSSEDVLISSLDKDKNQQQSNAPNSVISPNTSLDLIEGTPPAMHKRNQTAAVASDNNIDLQSEDAANVSHSVDQSSPKRLSAESVISPSVLPSERNNEMEASCSGLVMSKSFEPVCLEDDLFLSDDSVADPDWTRPKNKRRFIIDTNEVQSDETECELPTKPKRTNKTKRWHKRNEDTYERNQAKILRSQCLPYVNSKKQLMPAKTPKANPCTCRLKCCEKITEEKRAELCTTYWGLADYKRQKDYLLMNIVARAPVLRLVLAKKPRSISRFYYFTINGQKTRVCEKFFKATLCISNGPINTAFDEAGSSSGVFEGSDKRGKHEPANKTNQVDEDYVKEHIESFPTMESHYCRKTSSKLYLESNLSISKMYELYKENCKENAKTPVSENVYRRIFCTQYNYEFHKTKKDQCSTCHKYLIAKTENSADLALWEDKYKMHIYLKEKSLEAKELDKIRANTDETFNSITMDLEKVLHMPNSNISLLYYLRKINVYNATIYEARSPNEGLCYLWNELNGKKGSDEVGTALSLWISQLPPTIKEISIFTDTCGGQNRNQYLMCLLLYLVQTTELDVIEHKYLESGHSHMEVDSIHSAIEHQLKILPVYSMNDYCNVIKLARSNRKTKKGTEKKNPYKSIIMEYSDMLDLKELTNNLMKNRKTSTEGENIEWLKIKCFRFEKKNPGIVLYRYDFDSDYKKLDVTGKEREGRRKSKRKGKSKEPENLIFNYHDYEIKKAYCSVLPITTAKKKDLIKMCTEKNIPSELQYWYKNLPAKDGIDYLPDHDTQDELQEQDEKSE